MEPGTSEGTTSESKVLHAIEFYIKLREQLKDGRLQEGEKIQTEADTDIVIWMVFLPLSAI